MYSLRPFTELGQKVYDSTQLVSTHLAEAARLQEEVRCVDNKTVQTAQMALKVERDRLLLETTNTFTAAHAFVEVSEEMHRSQRCVLGLIRRRFDGEARAVEQIRSQKAFAGNDRVLIPDRFLDEVDEPYFNAGNPPRVYDPLFETAITMHAQGEVLASDKAVIILLHGAGAVYSSSNALLGVMNDLAKMETNGGKKRVFATVAVDLPFHGFGTRESLLKDNIAAYTEYLHKIVTYYAAFGKPVFLFGRSFGAVTAVEYAARYDNVKGVVHMSGLHPDWVGENVANMYANGFPINREGLEFASGVMRQLTYLNRESALLTSGLILYGLKDVEYNPVKQQALWPVLGARLGFGVLGFEDGEHNLFDTKNPTVHKAARAAVQQFILERSA